MAITQSPLIGAGHAATTGTTIESGSFTPPDDSLLVVVAFWSDTRSSGRDIPAISGGGLTWTTRVSGIAPAAYRTGYAIYTAPVTTGASMTVTLTASSGAFNNGSSIAAWGVTGYDTSDPVGAGSGQLNHGSNSGPKSIAFDASPLPGSILLGGGQIDDGNSPTDANLTSGEGWVSDYAGGVPSMSYIRYRFHHSSGLDAVAHNFANATATAYVCTAAIEINAPPAFNIRPDADDAMGEWGHSGQPDYTLLVTHTPAEYAASTTTPSFSTVDDSLLVAVVCGNPNNNGPTPDPSMTTSSLTWTLRASVQYPTGTYGRHVRIYTAPNASAGSRTLAVDYGEQQESFTVFVYEVTGHDPASPIGTKLEASGTQLSGAWTGNLDATPVKSSLIIGGIIARATVVVGSQWEELDRITNISTHKITFVGMGLTSTSVGFDELAVVSGNNYAIAMLEIKGTLVDMYEAIDESSIDDADYIISGEDPVNDVCKIRLSNPSITPAEPFKVRYRYIKQGVVGSLELRVRLLQGTTEIVSWTHSNIAEAYAAHTQTLTTGQFGNITDFNDLFLEFRANLT